MEEISVQRARELDKIEKRLIQEFREQFQIDEKNEEIKQKSFSPITNALEKIEEKLENVVTKTELMNLAPISLPEIKQIEEKKPKIISIGPIAATYLKKTKDSVFGIYTNEEENCYMIGNKKVKFENNDLIIDNKKYKGTKGLWRLLTDKDEPKPELYTEEDLENYKQILWETETMFIKNDSASKKPKSSQGSKYLNLIKPILDSRKKTGSGIRKYSENKIEYRYIDDLTKLDSAINYIFAQEKAGNNNFLNEKKAIKDFISNKLDELIEKPEGVKYLKRILSTISSPVLKEGSGFINDFINNLPFELHVPGYQFLGPGTKINKRIKRGDQGINKLDQAAKEHDIYYRDHTNVEERNQADEILEDKAIGRMFSEDASFDERLIAFPTALTMDLKRRFGMGMREYSLF